ncbi:tetratricopeptide repeat protein [Paraburkholderia sp. MMS20-SJTR3]|uniref:Tetratricopeptide repeat protein n=1 Tax=Paraburkholderia sejongensis TaxID=2886946 RepID=A0ABS8JUF7_9BURK|nr:tetratricopeptide repeat protein [Paraburkholderia sp. MMS20-SJTR3]MCC8393524.1 tetratricopeptide repeat protein [Paraburkholderia sp. MMS20-SJTR3]
MSYFGIGLHVLVAIYFAIHAVRTNQGMYWLFILFVFPLLGSVVYLFAVYLPSLRHSRGARAATQAISQFVDPNRALREARADFDRAPTVQHRLRLGDALLAAGNPREALEQFQAAANGPFATDPALLLGLARSQFAIGDYPAANTTLEKLFSVNPQERNQGEPALLYARTLAALNAPGTRAAFEQALTCANDVAPRCLFADWLAAQADAEDRRHAGSLYAEIVQDAKHWPRHAREHNREWLQRAQAALASGVGR